AAGAAATTHYFALATLGIAQVLLVLATGWIDLTGGANGLAGVPELTIAGSPLDAWDRMVFAWALVALVGLALYQIRRSLIGTAFALVRTDPYAAIASGVPIAKLRFCAFLASAGIGALAGALQVHTITVVSPEVLDFELMVRCLVMVVVGGVTRTSGAILGAFVVVIAPEALQVIEGYRLLAFGGLLLAAIVLAPEGVVGTLERLRGRMPRTLVPPRIDRQRPPVRSIPPTTRPVLVLERVSKRFGGVVALDDVTLSIGRGEIFGLIGPNGSGKTTLVNVATGLERPDAGRLLLSGEDATGLSPAAIAHRGVARTFQNVHLHPELSVLDNVAAARNGDLPGGALATLAAVGTDRRLQHARGEAAAIVDAVGLEAVADRPVSALPAGLQRRVEVARALARNPELLLLDEPAAGLTEAEQADLAARIRAFKTRGLAMVIIDHNLGFLLGLADRAACLDRGRLIAIGTPEQVRNDPDVIAAYIGAGHATEDAP
ncbi:MAG: ATP-binding cassette domain-containing protein, partial [Alphaproteobacteria bacterium]